VIREEKERPMATYVLVPGAWKGSWAFEAVVPLLERAGHTVHALTLTGLRPDDDAATVATANLDTHADDVLRLLDRAHVTDATLVGHSYGGMVTAVAADRAGGRISRLVQLDAYVPRDGESCWSATNEHFREVFAAGAAATGYAVRPPDGGDPRRRSHPLASFLQRIRLTGALDRIPRRSSSTARGGRTRRRSPSSALGSTPTPSGWSMTSRPATTRCTRRRRQSPHYCSTSPTSDIGRIPH
jgi:pimeloyl-ACP methyl ester carboxylesterase